jgi:hypothetical protein
MFNDHGALLCLTLSGNGDIKKKEGLTLLDVSIYKRDSDESDYDSDNKNSPHKLKKKTIENAGGDEE